MSSRLSRASTGSPGMDELLSGGLPRDRLHVVSGPPGSGKTTFAAQFITAGARRGEECVYVTMHETRTELTQDMAAFDFGFEKAMRASNTHFLDLTDESARQTLTQYGSAGGLRNRVPAMLEGLDADRAVIDSTMLLEHFVDDPDAELTEFITRLKDTDTTIILISEMTDPTAYSNEHYLAHGVLFFHNFLEGGGMTRAVQLIKMRGTAIDCDMRSIEFTDGGIQVYPDRTLEETYG
ncbi:RAD55 family ATPase [Halodesulfurarchaeum formicicum]|nr:ATPase domain-containing protein [Halodesulfurarchaeum formicicum]